MTMKSITEPRNAIRGTSGRGLRAENVTLPSFSQNANVINITINYGKGSDEQQE